VEKGALADDRRRGLQKSHHCENQTDIAGDHKLKKLSDASSIKRDKILLTLLMVNFRRWNFLDETIRIIIKDLILSYKISHFIFIHKVSDKNLV
jgi:hypothetical protein